MDGFLGTFPTVQFGYSSPRPSQLSNHLGLPSCGYCVVKHGHWPLHNAILGPASMTFNCHYSKMLSMVTVHGGNRRTFLPPQGR